MKYEIKYKELTDFLKCPITAAGMISGGFTSK